MVTEINLHRKKVSIIPLRILHPPEADTLVAERLELPHGLCQLVRSLDLLFEGRRLYRRSQRIDLTRVAVGSVLGGRVVRPVRVALVEVIVVVAIANEIAVLTSSTTSRPSHSMAEV